MRFYLKGEWTMKILRITAKGFPLFKENLDICFYTQQRVNEDDKECLYRMIDHYYLHCANAFIGINASGKTSVLKVVNLAMNIINNEPINHIEAKEILGKTKEATLCIYFFDNQEKICCLETIISSTKTKTNEIEYFIQSERLWEKSISSVKSKKYLTDFTGIEPIAVRSNNEMYLSDDVSFIIAHNIMIQ